MNLILWVILSVIFIILNVIDIITTQFATQKLDIRERNPFMKWIVHKHFNWAIAFKYIISIVLIISCWETRQLIPLFIYDGLLAAVCINNVIKIKHTRRALFVLSMNA